MTRYGKILSVFCGLDLALTLLGLHFGYFDGEVNPILAWFMSRWGLIGLAAARILPTAVEIFILEMVYRYELMSRPQLIRCMKLAIFGYVAILFGGLYLQYKLF